MPTDRPQPHALVTGGGKGIGLAVARRLRAAGWRVAILGRDEGALARAVADGAADGYEVADATDGRGLAAAIERLAGNRPFAAAVANAGAADVAPFEKASPDQFRRLFDVNVLGAVATFQAVLPGMRAAGHGRLVAIGSTASHRGYPRLAAYVASKHALLGVVRSLALELAGSGVSVNAISPGYTDTAMIGDGIRRLVESRGLSEDEARAVFARDNPAGRLIRPEEVADAVRQLCEMESDALSGQSIPLNCGEFPA